MSKRGVSLLLGLLLAAFITAAAFIANTYEMNDVKKILLIQIR